MELRGKHAHDYRVCVATILVPVLTQAPLFDEAALPVAGDGPRIVLVDD